MFTGAVVLTEQTNNGEVFNRRSAVVAGVCLSFIAVAAFLVLPVFVGVGSFAAVSVLAGIANLLSLALLASRRVRHSRNNL